MAPFHPTFMASPSFNRIEALLRCCIVGCVRGAALTHPTTDPFLLPGPKGREAGVKAAPLTLPDG